jgi:hypothetical protein
MIKERRYMSEEETINQISGQYWDGQLGEAEGENSY